MRPLLPLLLAPALIVNLAVFVWPMADLAVLAFRDGLPGGGIGDDMSWATLRGIVTDPFIIDLALASLHLSVIVTVVTLLCAYPIALFIHRASSRWRNFLLVLAISPLLISAVVRTYGFLLILGNGGFLPSMLRALGVARPPRLVFNETGVMIGLVEILMPTMILSLLAGFGRLTDRFEDAAASLGAAPFTVFRRIVLPLTLPGLTLGCLLTFVLAISSFITPKFLGGGRVQLLATEIYDQAIVTLNWPVAAGLSLLILLALTLTLALVGRAARLG